MKRKIALLGMICALMFSTILALPVEASENTAQKIVKVGYNDYAGFIEKDENGKFSGYAVDYLNEIAKYTGWKYEFVYDSWDNMLERLKTGDIEMICSAQYTEERDKFYDFCSSPIGYEATVVYTRLDDERYYFEDFEAFDGFKVGMMSGSYQNDTFQDYAEKNGFTYEPVYYSSDAQAFEDLENEKLDAVIVGGLSMRTGYKVVCEFASDPFYLMVPNGRDDLLDPINDAQTKIRIQNPYIQEDLFYQYYGSNYENTAPAFTREEAEYIKNSDTIIVANQTDRYPYIDTDKQGNLYGIQIDAMNLVAEMSGLHFEYVAVAGGVRATDYLKESDAKIFNGMMKSEFTNFALDLRLSDSLMGGSVTLIGRSGEVLDVDEPIVVALSLNYIGGQESLAKTLPNATYQTYEKNTDCLQAILTGKADYTVLDAYIATALLQKPKYEKLTVMNSYAVEQKMCLALLDTENPLLLSILNKCILRMGSDALTESIAHYTFGSPYHMTLSDYLYKYRIAAVVIILLILLVIAMLTVMMIIRTKAEAKIKVVNDELEESNEALEHKNSQLAVAIDKANQANDAKSQFLAQMSHEIRTPMNAIIGLTSIAETEVKNPDKMLDYLRKIDSSSKLLLGIINDVLDMSAIESKKLKIAETEFDFKQLLSSVTTVFYQQCKQKDIHFDVRLKGVNQETLIGDSLRVNQILMNLLSNAVKFTPAGGEITVLVIQASTSNDIVHMRFVVSDTGAGMSDDLKKRLFNPFEQEDATTARKHGGSGLGLAITHNIVELMHGSIKVESEKGKGSVFTVDIPFRMVQRNTNATDTAFSDLNVLVVDDDQEACEYTSLLLGRLGVKHKYVVSGEDALEELGEAEDAGEGYNVAIIDWKMPEMNGVEVTKQIREIFGNDTIIIIASAYDMNEIEEEGRLAGADYFIPKPLFQSSVFNILMAISNGTGYTRLTGKEEKGSYDFEGKKVLLAEDVALNMEVAVQLLKMVGLEVVCAEDGQIAIDIFKRSKEFEFDAILLDINMPNVDGYQAARAIRGTGRADAESMPIYAMTANAFTEDVAAALDAGMNGHIAKPIEQNVLYKTLQDAFSTK